MSASSWPGLAIPKPEPRKRNRQIRKPSHFKSRKIKRTCVVCATVFAPWQNTKLIAKYCSRRCYLAAVAPRPAMKSVQCALCGTQFRRTAAAIARVVRSFCSRSCSTTFYRGEQNFMFRGDKDPNRGGEWRRLAESVRVAHGHKCGRCGRTQADNGQKLSVDHIRPWRSFADKKEANDPINLVPLCRRCHSHKTSRVERLWLQGDVQAWEAWVRSLQLPSAATFADTGKGRHVA